MHSATTSSARNPVEAWDAVVVGSGPNGLAAAIAIARTGRRVLVLEARDRIGGGLATREATHEGFRHDVMSSVHPFAAASPFFRQLPLEEHGLEWVAPDAPFAHPLDDGSAVVAERDVARTAAGLGADGERYRRLIAPLVERWYEIAGDALGPLLRVPSHPLAMARFGAAGLLPVEALAKTWFRQERARALLAGVAAHVNLPLSRMATMAPALLMLVMAHRVNWPFPAGGAARLAEALGGYLRTLGGRIETGRHVTRLADLPPARAVLLDVTPRQLLGMAGDAVPGWYRWWLERFRYGPGVFKVNVALEAPIPWRNRDVRRAATVHLGGTFGEIAASEAAVARGEIPERPYVLLAQPTLFDPTRAPQGKHTAWAYCHVPHGCNVDMTGRILAQVERFAPTVRDLISDEHAMSPADMERRNPNLVGGDPGGGAFTLWQTVARPVPTPDPYATPLPGVYLCSASTPPGPGVHGMCGYRAARSALRRTLRDEGRP